jgi:hypothetical protein
MREWAAFIGKLANAPRKTIAQCCFIARSSAVVIFGLVWLSDRARGGYKVQKLQ